MLQNKLLTLLSKQRDQIHAGVKWAELLAAVVPTHQSQQMMDDEFAVVVKHRSPGKIILKNRFVLGRVEEAHHIDTVAHFQHILLLQMLAHQLHDDLRGSGYLE